MTNLRDALDELQDHQDASFVIACAVNLYSECLRRRAGRVLYGPKDVEKLLEMTKMLLDLQDPGTFAPAKRDEKPTEREVDTISDPFTQIAQAAQEIDPPTLKRKAAK